MPFMWPKSGTMPGSAQGPAAVLDLLEVLSGCQRSFQKILHFQRACPLAEVCEIKPVALGSDNPQNVGPLAVGRLASEPVPLQLAQEGVFRRFHQHIARRVFREALWRRTLEFTAVEAAMAGNEHVDLEAGRQVDEVEGRASPDCLPDSFVIQIELVLQPGNQERNR